MVGRSGANDCLCSSSVSSSYPPLVEDEHEGDDENDFGDQGYEIRAKPQTS
jgi:hypothetical protein